MKTANHKKLLFLGFALIIVAFVCILILFYQIVNIRREETQKVHDVTVMAEKISQEKEAAQQELRRLAGKVGREIEVDRLVSAAQQEYGRNERQRTAGDLWIDHENDTWVVTLGALNGVQKGTRLRVLSDGQEVGRVTAETVLDVISYVSPVNDAAQFSQKIYQVEVVK